MAQLLPRLGVLVVALVSAAAACSASSSSGGGGAGDKDGSSEVGTGKDGASTDGTAGEGAVGADGSTGDASAGSDSGGGSDAHGGSDTSVTDAGDGFEVGTGTQDASGPFSGTTDGGIKFTVTWGGGCWVSDGNGDGEYDQAMPFTLTTAQPIPLEATLFYDTDCNPNAGTDNLNDTGGTVGSGGALFWFIHHPDEKQTSAIWSFGDVTSGCVDYSNAPACN
jgi:hypothetical protein